MAPELYSLQAFDQKTDIYSCAMIFFEMLFGKYHALAAEGR